MVGGNLCVLSEVNEVALSLEGLSMVSGQQNGRTWDPQRVSLSKMQKRQS